MKTKGRERKRNSRNPRRGGGCGECSSQSKRAITTEREAEESGDAMNCQRTKTGRIQRKEQQRDAVVAFGKRERVGEGIEDVGIEQIQRIAERLMKIPPQNP